MFNSFVDNTWLGYMNIINLFTALTLFGPALPFIYAMIFVKSVVGLHAAKYQIIYLVKRSIPVKTKSIHRWLTVL